MLLSANFDITPLYRRGVFYKSNLPGPTTVGSSTPSPTSVYGETGLNTDGGEGSSDDLGGYSGGYGGGGSGDGGGGSSQGPSDDQKNAAKSLEAITSFNAGTIAGKGQAGMEAFDIADKNAAKQRNIQLEQNNKMANREWFKRQQDLQSTLKSLRSKMGNAYYGSAALDLADDLARVDDQGDVEILGNLEDNNNQAYQNYYETILENINSRNELAMNTEASLRELFGDYAAQLNNIHPKLASGEEGDNGSVIDRDNRAINVPDWFQKFLDENSFNKLKTGVYDMKPQGLVRDTESLEAVQRNGGEGTGSRTGSANDYYHSIMDSYERRTR